MKKTLQLIKNAIKWLFTRPTGRYIHVIAGMFIAALFAVPLNVTFCIAAALSAGFIKEFIVLWRGGTFDLGNFLSVIIGGLLMQITVIL